MKRPTLWLLAAALLALLSPGSAANLKPLDQQETMLVTAGICGTCEPSAPTKTERWELIGRHKSTPVAGQTQPDTAFINNGTTPMAVTHSYSDQCRRIITGGSVSLLRSMGLSLNSTYHCAVNKTINFTVPPHRTVVLYRGTMRYYTTSTYRLVITWSNGARDNPGLTESMREETAYDFLEVR